MIVVRDELLAALDVCRLAVGHKHSDVANFVKFVVDIENRQVAIATTDYEAMIMHALHVSDETNLDDVPEVFLLNYKRLHSLLKASTSANVQMSAKGKKVIVGTNGSYEFATYSTPDDFPFIDLRPGRSCRISSNQLSRILKRVATVVNKSAITPEYKGVYWDGVAFAATNGRSLCVARQEFGAAPPMFLPASFADIIPKCGDDVAFGCNDQGNWVVLQDIDGPIIAAYRLTEVSFPDYPKALDGDNQVEFSVDRKILIGILNRAKCFVEKDNDTIKISTSSDNTGAARANFAVKGKTSETIPASWGPSEGLDYEAHYSLTPLLKALKSMSEPQVTFYIKANSTLHVSEIIEPDDDGDQYIFTFATSNVIG